MVEIHLILINIFFWVYRMVGIFMFHASLRACSKISRYREGDKAVSYREDLNIRSGSGRNVLIGLF